MTTEAAQIVRMPNASRRTISRARPDMAGSD
jgi:hypothetical protein